MSAAIGSLCSGYGGLDEAAAQLMGGKVAWVSDIDKGACKILAHRYPDVPNLGDFTTTDWSTVKPIYMLTAGYPCQPFSHAGKREGTNDARHLWPFVLRALTALRPPFALFENVRGHLSLGFDQVLADLATHDYDARWIVLRAADIGAPHGRARLFILAADARRGGDRWNLVGAGRGAVRVGGVRGEDPDAGSDAGRDGVRGLTLMPTPRASDGEKGGPNQRGSSGDLMLPSAVAQLLPTPAVNDMGAAYTPDEWDAWTESMKAKHGNGNGHGKSLSIEAQRLLPTPSAADGLGGHERRGGARGDELLLNGVAKEMARLLPTPVVGDARNSRQSTAPNPRADNDTLSDVNHKASWGDYAPAIARWESILGRPAPAPTMTSTKGNPQLSPRFVEWMQGLPEGWVDDVPDMSRNEKLKALGNGVVTQQAVEAVRRLLALDGAR